MSNVAVAALDAAMESLRQRPQQFVLNVSSIGVAGIAQGGGTGMSVVAHGGGSGSSTTGVAGDARVGGFNFAESQVTAALVEQSQRAVELLSAIKAEIQPRTVDETSIMSKLGQLGQTYLPPAVSAVIEAAIKKAFGF